MKTNKFFLFLFLLFVPLFMSASCCGGQMGSATVTVYNRSDFVVTDIAILFGENISPFPSLSELQPGTEHTFMLSWLGQPAGNSTIQYRINDVQFGTEHEEGAVLTEYGYYYSPQRLKDGAKASIYIKNESYELVINGG